MPEPELAHFRPSETIAPLVSEIFEREKAGIQELFPHAMIEQVGSSAIPGALTLGEVDIQIRVSSEDFTCVSQGLNARYRKHRPELWTEEFAIFQQTKGMELPLIIAVTVIDSSCDEFSKLRDAFLKDRALLETYNDLKKTYERKELREYRKAKKAFFGLNGASHFLVTEIGASLLDI